jgi:2'-hydroxyisoflavone reductase
LPMWSADDAAAVGPMVEIQSSIDKGLAYRTLAQTAADTLQWHLSLPVEDQKFTRAGLEPAKEQELLAAWTGRMS